MTTDTMERGTQTGLTRESTKKVLEMVGRMAQELRPSGAIPTVSLDCSLERHLGMDSMARAELLSRLERAFEVTFSDQVLATAETPRDLCSAVAVASGVSQDRLLDEIVLDTERIGSVPMRANTLQAVLEWRVQTNPDRIYIYLLDEDQAAIPITFAGLWANAEKLAAGLVARGLRRGERVAIMLPTCAGYFDAFFGTLLAGGVPVPLYPPARLSQVEDHLMRQAAILRNCGAPIMITIPKARPLARLVRSQVLSLHHLVTVDELTSLVAPPPRGGRAKTGDIAFLQYTSGSTGQPKGVVLTHGNLLANLRAAGNAAAVQSTDLFVSWLPLYHDMGLIGAVFGSLYLGFPLVLMSPLSFLSKPARWLWAIHQYRATLSAGPNFAYELCLAKIPAGDLAGLDLSTWRLALNGAEPVSPSTMTRFSQRFAKYGFKPEAMFPVYGLAENSLALAFPPLNRVPRIDRIQQRVFVEKGRAVPAPEGQGETLSFASCGRPIPEHEVRIVDERSLVLGERQRGLLQFRGPSATQGYFQAPEATAGLCDGSWRHSGDLAYWAGGELFITGRVKDIIIKGGRNFVPYEVEQAAGEVAGVRKGCVAVFGVVDAARRTEKLVILAETRETDPRELERIRRDLHHVTLDLLGVPADEIALAPPGAVLKTSSGKIRRAACAEHYLQGNIGRSPRGAWRQFASLARVGIQTQLCRMAAAGGRLALNAWVGLLLLLVGPLAWLTVVVLPGLRRRQTTARHMARFLFKTGGFPVRVVDSQHLPRDRPCMVAANHASYLDAFVMTALLPPGFCFAAKSELRRNFFTRLPLSRLGAVFVERFDAKRGVADARQMTGVASHGHSLIVFPEGTFDRMPGILPFRMGAFTAAANTGLPIVPAVISGTRQALPAQSWLLRRAGICVRFFPPIMPGGTDWQAAVTLRDRVRSQIIQNAGEPDLDLQA